MEIKQAQKDTEHLVNEATTTAEYTKREST